MARPARTLGRRKAAVGDAMLWGAPEGNGSGGGRLDLPREDDDLVDEAPPQMDDVRSRQAAPSGVVKTHWYRAHSSGMSTAEQRTIVPVPAGWRRMSSTNRSTASIPSLRPNGPQKTTSEVSAWESSAVT